MNLHRAHDFRPRILASLSTLILLGCASLASKAHDSWFEPQTGPRGERLLALGTGNQFPVQETAIGREYLSVNGCEGTVPLLPLLPLLPLRYTDTALLMAVPAGATTCWLQLQAFEVTVPPDTVPLYFKEINASAEVRATWARWQARGLPWRETYTKHARALISDGPTADGASKPMPSTNANANASATTVSALPGPSPLGMDLRLLPTRLPLRVGDSITVEVQRDGKPLPGQAIELRGDSSPLGIWRRSDAQGRFSVTLPLAGRWVLRGVDLRVSTNEPEAWDSRFITFNFDVSKALPGMK